jgi:hypothetical protein
VALLGRVTEYWMNLLDENGGGVLVLVVRALQGSYTVITPEGLLARLRKELHHQLLP